MHEIEPFPVPLYVLALALPTFASDCDDEMRCRLAASRARPFSFSGCSATWRTTAVPCDVSTAPATTRIDSTDEFAMVSYVWSREMVSGRQCFYGTGETVAGVEKVARQSRLSFRTEHAYGAVVNGVRRVGGWVFALLPAPVPAGAVMVGFVSVDAIS
jgi:hypothetical protein